MSDAACGEAKKQMTMKFVKLQMLNKVFSLINVIILVSLCQEMSQEKRWQTKYADTADVVQYSTPWLQKHNFEGDYDNRQYMQDLLIIYKVNIYR